MKRLSSIAVLFLIASTTVTFAQSPGPDIDRSYLRNYPAGPFSQVSTSFGGLETVIPLFSLEGNGSTALSFSLRHRTNITPGTQYLQKWAGRGWFHSFEGEINQASVDIVQRAQGGGIQPWINGIPPSGVYDRRPGTRDTLRDIKNGSGVWTGYEVESLSSKTKTQYFGWPTDPLRTSGYLTNVIDAYGNTVHVTYDSNRRITRIDDASNLRYVTITYWDTSLYSLIRYVTLNYPGGSRQWELIHTNGNLTEVRWPVTGTTDPRPIVRLTYDSNSNITDVYDFNSNRWHYAYGFQPAQGEGTSPLVCTGVYPPSPTAPTTSYWTYGTTFAWSYANTGLNDFSDDEKICTVTERYGSYASPLTRTRSHVYFYNTPSVSTLGGNLYARDPIKRIQDPTVDGTTFSESYVWYYGDGTLTRYVDRRGKFFDFTYDTENLGLVYTSKIPANGYTDAQRTTNYYYDSESRLILTDAPGKDTVQRLRTALYYNAQHSVIKSVLDPKVDPRNGTTAWPAGLDVTSQTSYTATGEVASKWSGTDSPVTYSNFDAYGNARNVTSPDGKVTVLAFDDVGNKISETPPAPLGTTTYAYDSLSRLKQTTYPGGPFSTITYDAASNPLTTTDENGYVVTTTYDFMNRPLTVRQTVDTTVANDLVTTNGYDVNGNLTSVTNPRGKVTNHTYDTRDNKRTTTYPDLKTRQWTYDGDGRILTATDGKGQVTAFLYNDAGQLTNEQRKNGTTVVYQTVYTYNPDGNRATMLDNSTTTATTYAYDTASRLASNFQPIPNKTLVYTYEASGRRSTMSVFAGTATTGTPLDKWTYTYDLGLRLYTVKEKLGSGTEVTLATYTYHDAGLPNVRTNLNGTSATYAYDSRGRTSSITHRTGTTVQQTLSYVYDNANAITQYTNATLEGSTTNTVTTNYVHDRSYRLKSESRSGSIHSVNNFTVSYNYDKNGNRTSTVRDGATSVYTVDDNDKLLSGEGFYSWTYDNNGSPLSTTDGGTVYSFTYDRDNRVTSIAYLPDLGLVRAGKGELTASLAPTFAGSRGGLLPALGNMSAEALIPSGTDTFTYDGEGRRVRRVSLGVTTTYVYDGSTLVAEYPGTGSVYHAPGIGWTDGGGVRYYYRENGIGSNLAVLSASAVVQSRSEYDAYGVEKVILSGAKSNHRFAGRHGYYKDDNSGLSLLGARYYSSLLGRFLTQDPIGHGGGLNLYRYCSNSPLAKVDPDGKYEVRIAWRNVGSEAFHAFILVTDNVKDSKTYGWTWAFSAGPERHGLKSLTDPGLLVDRSGLWKRGQYDWRRDPDHGSWVLGYNYDAVGPLLNHISKAREDFRALKVGYNLTNGPNSNTFAHFILQAIDLYDSDFRKSQSVRFVSMATDRSATDVLKDLRMRKGHVFPGWNPR